MAESKTELEHENETLRKRMARWAAEAAAQMHHVKATAEVGLASLAVGYLKGRYSDPATGELKVFGIDVDLGATFVLKGLAFGASGMLGDWVNDFHNAGNGTFAFWTGSKGVELGMEAADGGGGGGTSTGRMAPARRGQQHLTGARAGDGLRSRIAAMAGGQQ